jgi:hypothetical protein
VRITAAELRERLMAEKSALERDITDQQNRLTQIKNDLQLLDRQSWSFDLPDPEPVVRIVSAKSTPRETPARLRKGLRGKKATTKAKRVRSPETRENMRLAQIEAWKRRRAAVR